MRDLQTGRVQYFANCLVYADLDDSTTFDAPEEYEDEDGSGHYTLGEPYTDTDGSGDYTKVSHGLQLRSLWRTPTAAVS